MTLPIDPITGKPIRRIHSDWLYDQRRKPWVVPGITHPDTAPRRGQDYGAPPKAKPARPRPKTEQVADTLASLGTCSARDLQRVSGACLSIVYRWIASHQHLVTITRQPGTGAPHLITWKGPPCPATDATDATPAPIAARPPAIPSPTSTPKTASPASPPPKRAATTTPTTTGRDWHAPPLPVRTITLVDLLPHVHRRQTFRQIAARLQITHTALHQILAGIPDLTDPPHPDDRILHLAGKARQA